MENSDIRGNNFQRVVPLSPRPDSEVGDVFAVNVGGSVFQAYTDRLFAQAALLAGPDPSLFLMTALEVLLCGAVTVAVVALFRQRRHAARPPKSSATHAPMRLPMWTLVIFTVIFDLTSLAILYSTFFQLRITTSFTQHMIAIAPFISDEETKIIRSRWTQMKGKRDYDAIYAHLSPIANANQISLPENLVFTPTAF